jgi:hypothetical protein
MEMVINQPNDVGWQTRVQWLLLHILCFALVGTLFRFTNSSWGQPFFIAVIGFPQWLILRAYFRSTDNLFGLSGLFLGWLLGWLLLIGGAILLFRFHRYDWILLGVVVVLIAGVGLALLRLVRRHYERIRRWTYAVILSVISGGITGYTLWQFLATAAMPEVLRGLLSGIGFGASYGLLTALCLSWVIHGKDGVTTLATPLFSGGYMAGAITNLSSEVTISGKVAITDEVVVWNSGAAIWKRTIQTVEIWIDGRKRGEAILSALPSEIVNEHCQFLWEWWTPEDSDGEHLVVVQAINNQHNSAQASLLIRTENDIEAPSR